MQTWIENHGKDTENFEEFLEALKSQHHEERMVLIFENVKWIDKFVKYFKNLESENDRLQNLLKLKETEFEEIRTKFQSKISELKELRSCSESRDDTTMNLMF